MVGAIQGKNLSLWESFARSIPFGIMLWKETILLCQSVKGPFLGRRSVKGPLHFGTNSPAERLYF